MNLLVTHPYPSFTEAKKGKAHTPPMHKTLWRRPWQREGGWRKKGPWEGWLTSRFWHKQSSGFLSLHPAVLSCIWQAGGGFWSRGLRPEKT